MINMPEPETVGETQLVGETMLIGAPVTGDVGIRPGEKFCEDALAETCEALRVELGNEKNTTNELRAKIADLEARRDISSEVNLDIMRRQVRDLALQLGMTVQ
jgi:hypothetical protein